MKRPLSTGLLAMLVWGGWLLPGRSQLQEIPMSGPASQLTSEEHYPVPDDKQVRVRLTGAKVTPLPDMLFKVKDLTVDSYAKTGELQGVAVAPECIYDPVHKLCSSSGHLTLRMHDDKIHTEASDGFYWEQGDQSISSTNVGTIWLTNVVTIIHHGAWKESKP
jgi:hypothetical protein